MAKEVNATLETSKTIVGMKLTRLNETNGLWNLIAGGINESFVTFNFKGDKAGEPYDFNLELYGNSAESGKLSMILMILSGILYALLK